jgi:hypothetical protein
MRPETDFTLINPTYFAENQTINYCLDQKDRKNTTTTTKHTNNKNNKKITSDTDQYQSDGSILHDSYSQGIVLSHSPGQER